MSARRALAALLRLLPLLTVAGCSFLIDVDRCKRDEACEPGQACHAGRCQTLAPVDATPDAASPEPADGAVPGGFAEIGSTPCAATDVPGLLATYTFGDTAARRHETSIDYEDLAALNLGFVPEFPFSVVWDARFRLENRLRETFVVDTNGLAELRVDNDVLWTGTGAKVIELELVPGDHTLSLRVAGLGEEARVHLDEGPAGSPTRVVGAPNFSAVAECDGVTGACQPVDDAALFEVESNVFHCGACGRPCRNPSGPTTCVAGQCRPVCVAPAEAADGDEASGCEAVVLRGPQCGDVPATGSLSGQVRLEDVEICPYQRGKENTGRLRVAADSILVVGMVDGHARGFGGGGGGGGGAGTVRCGDTACPAAATFTAGGVGGPSGPRGGSGSAGERGRTSTCFDDPPVTGAGGRGGNGGGLVGGAGGPGGSLRIGTRAVPAAESGQDGGYAEPGANGDVSTELTVLRGSGGGGGGGAAGLALDLCCSICAGGGGGAGSPGGALIILQARDRIEIAASGTLRTTGARGSAANGVAGTEVPGAGGDARREGAGIGGLSARTDAMCIDAPALQAPAPGARGGGGAGGGVLLAAPVVVLDGEIDARGSQAEENGGTVKIASCGPAPDVRRVRAGRVAADLPALDCD